MKILFIAFLSAIILSFTSCSDNKAATTEKQTTSKASAENKETPAVTQASPGTGLVGTWKLEKEVFDDNGNRIPDEEELKKAYGNNYMLQLNADGSCRIQKMFSGRYEKKIENGKDMLYVYRKKVEGEEDKDPIPDIYQVTTLKNDELVLQIIEAGEPSSFWFFKRIN